MTANLRFLLPQLPPELRNEIYGYLSTRDDKSVAINKGLSMKLKEYSSKHTTVQICPVHYGYTSLLALEKYKFQEAHEYFSWLLNNALELRIGVIFKGRVSTFIQADWDKKIAIHLRKLAKQHLWLKKVAKYSIQVIWDSTDGALKSRNKRRTVGQIPKDMVKTLTVLMDENVKRRRGDICVRLCLEHRIAVENALSATKIGLADFFLASNESSGCWRLTQGVWKQPYPRDPQILRHSPQVADSSAASKERVVLSVEEGLVEWAIEKGSQMVLMRTLASNKAPKVTVGDSQPEDNPGGNFVLMELMKESLGHR